MKKLLFTIAGILTIFISPLLVQASLTTVPWRYDTIKNVIYPYPDVNEKVGIGTTTPNWLLQIASTNPSFAISDSDAILNSKHWLIKNTSGIFSIATTSDIFTNTLDALTISGSGNVQINTVVDSIAKLDVLGEVSNSQTGIRGTGHIGIDGEGYGTDVNSVGVNGSGSSIGVEGQNNSDTGYAVICNQLGNGYCFYGTGGQNYLSGKTGISSTTPFSYLSVTAPSSVPTTSLFAVASSTNATLFNVLGKGNVGIGTTSPFATFSISGNSSIIPFVISTTTPTLASSTLFMVDQVGDHHFGGGTPVVSSCGTGGTLDGNSTDQSGTVTFGTTASGCTITFSQAKQSSPHCIVSTRAVSLINAYTVTESTTVLTITQAASDGVSFDYFCPLGH